MRIKIVSDGTPCNTKVVNVETDEVLDMTIAKISWSIEIDSPARVVLEIIGAEVEVEGETDG